MHEEYGFGAMLPLYPPPLFASSWEELSVNLYNQCYQYVQFVPRVTLVLTWLKYKEFQFGDIVVSYDLVPRQNS